MTIQQFIYNYTKANQNSLSLKNLIDLYTLVKLDHSLLKRNIIRLLLKISHKKYPKSKINAKLMKLLVQTGSGLFSSVAGNVASGLVSTASSVASGIVNNAGSAVLNQLQGQSDKAKFIIDHLNCDKPGLLECVGKSSPIAIPLVEGCAVTGAETLGAGCAPLLTELATTGGICIAKNCKPKWM